MPDNEVLAAIWSACMCLENQRDVCWSARANDFPTFLVGMSFREPWAELEPAGCDRHVPRLESRC